MVSVKIERQKDRSAAHSPPLPPIYICKYKKLTKFGEIPFLFKNQGKGLAKSLIATASLSNTKFDIFTCPINLICARQILHS